MVRNAEPDPKPSEIHYINHSLKYISDWDPNETDSNRFEF